MGINIGGKLRSLRQKNNLTQKELADRCELSKGFISQLESNQTSPSLSTLEDILTTLGSSFHEFFSDEQGDDPVCRKEDVFIKEDDGVTIHWLIPNAQKKDIEPILVTIQPGAETETDLPHMGEEFGYVLSGAVTLELGGKSPCIVDETANLRVAARRLAFGKLLNCGQTCVAPDYLLISRKVKDAFLPLLEREIQRMVGENALVCDSYVHMVNEKHFRRVCGLIDPDKVIFGGQADERTLRIQPTIMDRVTADDAVMQEEIFGPLLPVIAYDSIDEALAFVNGREHPLALYLFSEDSALQKRVLASVPFGGGCINDTIVHLATSRMGFGGVGHSGMGSYHGKKSFDTFSHEKSVLKKSTRIDMPVRYMPYTPLKDRLLRVFLR